ncbi:unnamed protein product [Trifolium pratense]|uniref:Uncharacterized protein n=1 Tax=Trifolium pratense TaxID=57577 RepID=A0ACB0LG15_TRIPR|nr:unnamed protein product [Trifolium pratense]
MGKSLKLISTIILFIFLFFTTKEVASNPSIFKTSIQCKTVKECPDVVEADNKYVAYICMNGYCHRMTYRP